MHSLFHSKETEQTLEILHKNWFHMKNTLEPNKSRLWNENILLIYSLCMRLECKPMQIRMQHISLMPLGNFPARENFQLQRRAYIDYLSKIIVNQYFRPYT